MNFSKTGERSHTVDKAGYLAGTVLSIVHPLGLWHTIKAKTSIFPNLKYAKPKYKNIESILKYAERDEDKGGVKLVIMNFND